MNLERVTPLVWTLLWLIIGCQSIGAFVEDGREAALTEALNDTGATNCYRGMANDTTNQYQRLELMRDNTLDRDILCDTQTDGGGWIVIQRRKEGDVDFYRNWTAYKNGFGTPPGDFWLGNEAIYELTNEDAYELRIDFDNYGLRYMFAVYSSFKLESEADNYTLRLGNHSGTLGEVTNRYGLSYSNGLQFSTYDRDNVNDTYPFGTCYEVYLGGWWYDGCLRSYLNGRWDNTTDWNLWWQPAGSYNYFASQTEMKIRRIGAFVEGGIEAALTGALNDTGATNCYRGMANDTTNQYQRLELMRDNTLDRDILCDTQTDGGGWIVIQRRTEGDVDFYRNWTEYKNGFGTPPGDFWLGNEAIYELTNEDDYELRIDFNHHGTTDLFAVYTSFRLESEADNYRLQLGSHSGTLPEFRNGFGLSYSDDLQFITYDRDNGTYPLGRCHEIYLGGWWYNGCLRSNLNGRWDTSTRELWWNTGLVRYYARRTEMKIRLV